MTESQAEIGELGNGHLKVDVDILGGNVSVNNILGMEVVESVGDIKAERAFLGFGQLKTRQYYLIYQSTKLNNYSYLHSFRGQRLSQGSMGDKLGDQDQWVVVIDDSIHLHNIWMVEFAMEAGTMHGVSPPRVVEPIRRLLQFDADSQRMTFNGPQPTNMSSTKRTRTKVTANLKVSWTNFPNTTTNSMVQFGSS